jgi:hypothetical protein
VIIYESFAGAMQATSALREIAASLSVDIDWHIEAWRLDLLKFPPTADKALDDAEPAHLVLIANLAFASFPSWLKNWLERWISLRQIRLALLVILHGELVNDNSIVSGIIKGGGPGPINSHQEDCVRSANRRDRVKPHSAQTKDAHFEAATSEDVAKIRRAPRHHS